MIEHLCTFSRFLYSLSHDSLRFFFLSNSFNPPCFCLGLIQKYWCLGCTWKDVGVLASFSQCSRRPAETPLPSILFVNLCLTTHNSHAHPIQVSPVCEQLVCVYLCFLMMRSVHRPMPGQLGRLWAVLLVERGRE